MEKPSVPGLNRGDLQARAVRGALWTGVHTMVSLPLAFGVNILVARVLGVADYGRLTYLTTVIMIASVIAGVGVGTALVQFGSKAHAAGNHEAVRLYLSSSQGFRILFTGPIVALVVLSVVRVEWWLLGLALLFGVGAPAIFGSARAALTIENRTDRGAQISIAGNMITQAAVVAAVLLVGTADAVWSARVIAGGLVLALPLAIISKQYRSAVLRPAPPWRLPREFWAFALPTGLAGIIGALVSNRTEVIFLDWFSDEVAMGLFGLAFGLAGHVYAPAQAFVGPLVPAVSALAAVDEAALQKAFLRTTRAGSAVAGLVVAAALPGLACVIPTIYGSGYAGASDLLIILGVGSAVALVGAPHQAFLMARLGGRRLLMINVLSLCVNIAIALLLIPSFGAWGAAIACSVATAGRALHLSVGEVRNLAIRRGEFANAVGAMPTAISICAISWLFARNIDADPVVLGLVAGLSGIVLYGLLLRVFKTGLSGADALAIVRVLPRPLRGVGRVGLSMLTGVR